MYEVNQEPANATFRTAWQCAGKHLQRLGGEGINWLRADLNPPLAEHLSFRLGNQLFFIYIEIGGGIDSPSSKDLFLSVACEATAIPSLMPMEATAGTFQPVYGGWGLRHARSGVTIDPPSLVSSEHIEMSQWELHDFSIQIVCNQIEKSGGTILSKQPSPHIDPSLWFRDKSGPAFVVLRSGRYPAMEIPKPHNTKDISASCDRMSRRGFFASVAVANSDQQNAPESVGALPLYRGHGMVVRYNGLEPL